MPIYEKFVGASRDDFISLEDAQRNYTLSYDKSFNFAYDVVDELGRTKPDKLAMLWVSATGEEIRFTFEDMMLESNRAANYLKYMGVGMLGVFIIIGIIIAATYIIGKSTSNKK